MTDMAATALLIDGNDNVAVVLADLRAGECVRYRLPDGGFGETVARSDIPIYHKVAIRSIPAGAPVLKYGERIGYAYELIQAGEHVHLHNLADTRGRLMREGKQ